VPMHAPVPVACPDPACEDAIDILANAGCPLSALRCGLAPADAPLVLGTAPMRTSLGAFLRPSNRNCNGGSGCTPANAGCPLSDVMLLLRRFAMPGNAR